MLAFVLKFTKISVYLPFAIFFLVSFLAQYCFLEIFR